MEGTLGDTQSNLVLPEKLKQLIGKWECQVVFATYNSAVSEISFIIIFQSFVTFEKSTSYHFIKSTL